MRLRVCVYGYIIIKRKSPLQMKNFPYKKLLLPPRKQDATMLLWIRKSTETRQVRTVSIMIVKCRKVFFKRSFIGHKDST